MIELVKSRLVDNVPEIKFFGEAPDFQAAAERNPTVTPACFVISISEEPAPNALSDIMLQRVRSTVGIVLVVRNVADSIGAAARLSMEDLRVKVKAQLFGWQASVELDPFERGSSHLLAFRDGHVWWQDLYITSYYDRSL